MSETWTISELAERAAEHLRASGQQVNGRVREVPSERLIRWYATIGLLDPPLTRRGRVALYGRRHLLQLVAIKRMQADGSSIAEIQVALAGATDTMLARAAHLTPPTESSPPHPPPVPAEPSTQERTVVPPPVPAAPAQAAPAAPGPTPPQPHAPPSASAPPNAPRPPATAALRPEATPGPAPHQAPPRDPSRVPAPTHDLAPRRDQVPAAGAGPDASLTADPAPPSWPPAVPGGSSPSPPSPSAPAAGPGSAWPPDGGSWMAPAPLLGAPGGPDTVWPGEGARPRFWARRPQHGPRSWPVHGVRLAEGVTLLIDGAGRTPSEADIEAVLAAAGPLLAVLEERRLHEGSAT
ncbi:MerR family transcriptional regulator [Nonomuraea sp. NPDC003804]|uniref:helix-turn-helix domain-containing protein n=1 Tax=Nonomuraea sp. NPDC003804 TaxID=3154547 RepID=UPI0033A01D7E